MAKIFLFVWLPLVFLLTACREDVPQLDPGSGTASADVVGYLDAIHSNGLAQGWAFSKSDSEKGIEIRFYLDGDYLSGKEIGSVPTESLRQDVNDYYQIKGNHAFGFWIPRDLRDDREHFVYVYAQGSKGLSVLQNSPFKIFLEKDKFIGPKNLPKAFIFPTTKKEYEFPIADANSPLVWQSSTLTMFASSAGRAHFSVGHNLDELTAWTPVIWKNQTPGGHWLEAVIKDDHGILYGYYHNEPPSLCGNDGKTAPRIGAARSGDGGRTWVDSGIIIEAPLGSEKCGTTNHFFNGGVGDFSAILDRDSDFVYFFFGSYAGISTEQGVVAARMKWSDRDTPVGRVSNGTIIFPVARSWHDEDGKTDAFWGPSIHYNTYLGKYVILLNHAIDNGDLWTQEGIYVSYSSDLEKWSTPYKIYNSSNWYPQVIGFSKELGTDKLAGRYASFKLGQSIRGIIEFGERQEQFPVPPSP